ncbi:hypothetical protein [Spirochaeta thermophila]|uniref:hypothetical protein n=1 Tax=Winmispira thermophila TaxID=154 RepID=UPI0005A1B1A3|nr:hypothetical protein [Spirochaeta thermophila]
MVERWGKVWRVGVGYGVCTNEVGYEKSMLHSIEVLGGGGWHWGSRVVMCEVHVEALVRVDVLVHEEKYGDTERIVSVVVGPGMGVDAWYEVGGGWQVGVSVGGEVVSYADPWWGMRMGIGVRCSL